MSHHLPWHLVCRLSGIILCLLVCLLSFSAKGFGQTVISNELITVQFEIEDKTGVPVTNLKASDFLILEDGVKQTPDHVKEQKVAVVGKVRIWYRVGYYSTNDKLDGTFRAI